MIISNQHPDAPETEDTQTITLHASNPVVWIDGIKYSIMRNYFGYLEILTDAQIKLRSKAEWFLPK